MVSLIYTTWWNIPHLTSRFIAFLKQWEDKTLKYVFHNFTSQSFHKLEALQIKMQVHLHTKWSNCDQTKMFKYFVNISIYMQYFKMLLSCTKSSQFDHRYSIEDSMFLFENTVDGIQYATHITYNLLLRGGRTTIYTTNSIQVKLHGCQGKMVKTFILFTMLWKLFYFMFSVSFHGSNIISDISE